MTIYFRNRFGETPVESAVKSGKKEVVELLDKEQLLPSGNDPKLPSPIIEVRKFTQHIWAMWNILFCEWWGISCKYVVTGFLYSVTSW